MKKQGFPEFTKKYSEALKDLSKNPWWVFEQNNEKFLIKGFCSAENSRYSILITNFSRSYFARAGSSQIQKEIEDFNPMIQGGISGVLPLLNSCISKLNEEAKYTLIKNLKSFELETIVKGLFQFKWAISLEKQSRSISKKIVENLIVMPLTNTILIQDHALKAFEETTKKKSELDLKLVENKNFLLINSSSALEPFMAGFLSALKVEENKVNRVAEVDNDLKRKANTPVVAQKMFKKADGYVESEAEVKRKIEIQARLAKKKDKKKLDFI